MCKMLMFDFKYKNIFSRSSVLAFDQENLTNEIPQERRSAC